MHGSLSAANRHSAAGRLVIGRITPDDVKQFIDRIVFAKLFQRAKKAGVDALHTVIAALPVDRNRLSIFALLDSTLRANINAFHAALAEHFHIAKLRIKLLTLRVAAPFAAQRAALQKDRGPDAVAVYHRTVHNIEHDSLILFMVCIHTFSPGYLHAEVESDVAVHIHLCRQRH